MRFTDWPGTGTARCGDTTLLGWPCLNYELIGIGYCLHHCPDELLAEAEALCGYKRCRKCRQFAVKGSDPPRCKRHGCNRGSMQRRNADMRATAIEIAEQALGLRKRVKKRGIPVERLRRAG